MAQLIALITKLLTKVGADYESNARTIIKVRGLELDISAKVSLMDLISTINKACDDDTKATIDEIIEAFKNLDQSLGAKLSS